MAAEGAENVTKVKTRRYCSVPYCKNFPINGISLHYFPKEEILRRKWAIACKIGKCVTKYMAACSAHFKENDFFSTAGGNKRRCLKPYAVPSRLLPRRSFDIPPTDEQVKAAEDRKLRLEARHLNRSESDPGLSCENEPIGVCDHDLPSNEAVIQENEDDEESLEKIAAEALVELRNVSFAVLVEKGVQVFDFVSNNKKFSLLDLMDTDEELSAFTGVTFMLLDNLTEAVNAYEGDTHRKSCSTRDRIALTLCKLRLGLSFLCMSVLFGVKRQTCSNYFFLTLESLRHVLDGALYWPSKEEVISSMPLCFQNFKETKIVLDCTEVPVQKPKCLQCRLKMYSHYKGRETVKVLIGIAPSGLITFVSKTYGGRASDKAIFVQSKLLEKFESNKDAIMVDKGFLIENECAENGITLIRPPFLGKDAQLSREDANKTRKFFKIFQSTLSHAMVPYCDSIWVVVAALTNLSSPIMADDKFL